MMTRLIFALLFLLAAPIRAVGFPQTAFQSTSAYRSAGLQPADNSRKHKGSASCKPAQTASMG